MPAKRRKRKRMKVAFHRPPTGALPGTLIVDPKSPPLKIRVLAYGPDACEEKTVENLEDLRTFLREWPVVWVDVDGLGDVNPIRPLGEIFDLPPLAMEDVVPVHQRAKVEVYGQQLFVVARMMTLG